MEITLLNSLLEMFEAYRSLIIWFGSISLFIFLFSLLTIKWLVALIPEDYFINRKASKMRSSSPALWYIVLIIKNVVGYSLVLGGIMMLVLPGQGVFTIIIGLMLSNYPGKYSIERKFIAIPSILKSINWLRQKSNKPPLNLSR
ncbi:PGPGW domain-containing protein [Gammaproteobacteria bacterium]|nr:PGPGW domain-containing protein [Gammaproteobacteria bacterium]